MTESPSRWLTSPFVGLIAFFLVLAGGMYLLIQFAPSLRAVLTLQVGEIPAVEQFRGAFEQSPAAPLPGAAGGQPAWLVVVLALVGSLLFAVPLAWTYTVTKRAEGYDRSVVHMILMLPVAVSAVVLVVFGNLALAFALAGIVAAVRFRTTLKDVKDAVFAFVAIGIGLAAGTGSWLLAGLLSLLFSLLVLVLWRFEVGANVGRGAGLLTLAEALTPGDDAPAVAMGDPALVAPLSPAELKEVTPRIARLARYVKADALREKGKYRELLLVYAAQPDAARKRVEALLADCAERWQLVDTFPGRNGTSTLAYLVRLAKQADASDLAARLLPEDEAIRAFEIKSVRGLRKRLT